MKSSKKQAQMFVNLKELRTFATHWRTCGIARHCGIRRTRVLFEWNMVYKGSYQSK